VKSKPYGSYELKTQVVVKTCFYDEYRQLFFKLTLSPELFPRNRRKDFKQRGGKFKCQLDLKCPLKMIAGSWLET